MVKTLPTTGEISAFDITKELGRSGTQLGMNDADARMLAEVPDGEIKYSDFRGKSYITAPEDGIFDLTIGYKPPEYNGDTNDYGYMPLEDIGGLNYKGIYINGEIYKIRIMRAEFYDNPLFGKPKFYLDIAPVNSIINIGDYMTVTIIETNQSFTGMASRDDSWFIRIEDDILAQYLKDNLNNTVQIKIEFSENYIIPEIANYPYDPPVYGQSKTSGYGEVNINGMEVTSLFVTSKSLVFTIENIVPDGDIILKISDIEINLTRIGDGDDIGYWYTEGVEQVTPMYNLFESNLGLKLPLSITYLDKSKQVKSEYKGEIK